MRILVLEDNPADVELAKRELRKAGLDFTVQWVQDRRTFVAALETSAPDLVLADYALPGFDGLTALTLARQRWRDVPVIIVSGAIGEELAIETLKAGATDYVLKQRLSRLGPVVRRALVEARERAAKRRAEEARREAIATLESKVAQRTPGYGSRRSNSRSRRSDCPRRKSASAGTSRRCCTRTCSKRWSGPKATC